MQLDWKPSGGGRLRRSVRTAGWFLLLVIGLLLLNAGCDWVLRLFHA